jgi:hypothetical protein
MDFLATPKTHLFAIKGQAPTSKGNLAQSLLRAAGAT